MKKLYLAVFSALSLISTPTLSALTSAGDDKPHSRVQVSFFPPLSTNGRHSGDYTNDFSFNILAGSSKNEQAFSFTGLVSVVKNNVTGFHFTGLTNHIGNNSRGFIFGGLFNYVGGEGEGLMFGGLANIVGSNHKGLQFGGLFNRVSDFEGLQFGGLFNTANNVKGFQFGGLVNLSNNVKGLQFGGLINSTGNVKGLQFGGLVNLSDDVKGFQFGGLANIAKRVHGLQFAGLVNVAEESDYPIGLINIIKNGEMSIAIGYNEIGTASLTFRSGGRVLYGILGVGYNHKVADSNDAITIVGGYGAHINILPWFRINNEFTVEHIGVIGNDYNNTFKSGYALLPAFSLGNFEIFGGPSVNYMNSEEPELHSLFQKNPFWKKENGSRLQQAYIGWQIGLQVLF